MNAFYIKLHTKFGIKKISTIAVWISNVFEYMNIH